MSHVKSILFSKKFRVFFANIKKSFSLKHLFFFKSIFKHCFSSSIQKSAVFSFLHVPRKVCYTVDTWNPESDLPFLELYQMYVTLSTYFTLFKNIIIIKNLRIKSGIISQSVISFNEVQMKYDTVYSTWHFNLLFWKIELYIYIRKLRRYLRKPGRKEEKKLNGIFLCHLKRHKIGFLLLFEWFGEEKVRYKVGFICAFYTFWIKIILIEFVERIDSISKSVANSESKARSNRLISSVSSKQ